MSSPAPHDIAATRLFSRRIVSQSLTRSSRRISLKIMKNTVEHRAADADFRRFHYSCWEQCASPSNRNTYYKVSLILLKSGRLCGSYAQHCDINEYKRGGQSKGNGRRSPFSSLPITSLFLTPWNGLMPIIRISHVQTPNIHTSLAVVKRRKLIDSGAIHLIGNIPLLEW